MVCVFASNIRSMERDSRVQVTLQAVAATLGARRPLKLAGWVEAPDTYSVVTVAKKKPADGDLLTVRRVPKSWSLAVMTVRQNRWQQSWTWSCDSGQMLSI